MRVPVQWLADYVDIDLPTEELAAKMTMAGLKIEAIDRIGADWQDVITAAIVEVEPHPTSKKPLSVAKVDVGGRVVTIVTGAPNVRSGDRVALVPVGGLLPHGPDGEPMVIQARPMAGITSEGMLASERELGISDEHSGIYILPPDVPVGVPLRTVMGGDVLDIETNINRPDTLSMIGVAREVAAITGQQLTLPNQEALDGNVEWMDEESFRVEVDAPDLCPRYTALRIEGTEVKASPYWMAARLEAAGMRPINSLVDITNYVMLEYGQPMHAFDTTRLRGGKIVVRRAKAGEHLQTLDGVDRVLSPENLVIADEERAVAVAGVMGGEDSEITSETSGILLESATFDPISVRRTAQSLKLRTESSIRFEKGLPQEQTVLGARRFLQLLAQISHGPLRAARISDVSVDPPPPRRVRMALRDLDRLVGVRIPPEQAAEYLSLLGFGVTIEEEALSATIPFWRRVDVERSADLVEEVARMAGYDVLPATLPRRTMPPPSPLPELYWEGVVREKLLGVGVSEVVTGALTSAAGMARLFQPGSNGHGHADPPQWERLVPNAAGVYAAEALVEPLELVNPPTQDRRLLRLTLLPSVLDVVTRNLKNSDERLAFFEVARTFFKRSEDLPYERRTLAVALSGRRSPRTWQTPAPMPYSLYDLKGMLALVLDGLHIRNWRVERARHPALHPGRAATVCVDSGDVAYFGELHPEVAAAFGIEDWTVQVAEVDLDTLFRAATNIRVFRPLPRHPAARRDIAVVVSEDTPASDVMRVVHQAGGDLLEQAEIFDVYSGGPLPMGTKSIAVAMEFRAPGATLTQEEVNEVMDRITQALKEQAGGTLRD